MEYIILTESSAYKLQEKVNEYLKNGWKLLGGHIVTVQSINNMYKTVTSYNNEYSQSMIKEG